MKKSLFILVMFGWFLLMSNSSCDDQPSSDEIQHSKQEQVEKEAQKQVGMPVINNYQEKKWLKWIFELRDNSEILNYCYSYSEYQGKYMYIGRCIGFPIPYSTQFTNPQKAIHTTGGWYTIPQADPNTLFSPPSANATWVLLIDPKTKEPHPMYFEPNVVVVAFPFPDEICIVNFKENKTK